MKSLAFALVSLGVMALTGMVFYLTRDWNALWILALLFCLHTEKSNKSEIAVINKGRRII